LTPALGLSFSAPTTAAQSTAAYIDVYPDEVPSQPEMSGYQLPIAMDIFRGRYRESVERPHRRLPATARPCLKIA